MSEPRSAGPIARALSVRPDEVETVRGLMAAAFVLGAGLILFYSSANAIFLTRYDISALPWVYIVNALVVVVVGLAYGAWSRRVTPAKALVRLTFGLSATVGALWVWSLVSDDRVVAFALATWFRLLFIYAVLGLWEIASAVFDIRQAKRLFAAVALGMMLAFVIGGALTPVLGGLLGPTHMVGVSALLLGAYAVRLAQLLARNQVGAAAGSAQAAPAGPREILRDRYSRRMVWMKSVTITLLYVTEYVFYEQAAAAFDSEASLAGFLGVFMGAMTIAMVLVTGLVSGRFISRYGIRVATLTLPVGMVAVATVAGVYGIARAVDTLFFALVCLTLATDHVLGNAIGEPAGAVLFQPMSPERRMRVRLAVDGWLGSLALVAAGLLLLVLQSVDLDSVAPYMFLIAAVGGVGVIVAQRQYQDYVRTLHEVTTLGFGDADAHRDVLDHAALTELLGHDRPGTILAAATLDRTWRADPVGPRLHELLSHPRHPVIDLALDVVSDTRDVGHADAVRATLARRELPLATRQRALRCLSSLDPAGAVDWLRSHGDDAVARLGAGVLLRHPPTAAEGAAALAALAAGGTDDRIGACHVVATCERADRGIVHALLDDPEAEVVVAALDAIEGPVPAPVSRRLVEHAGDGSTRRAAVAALGRIAAHDLPDLGADLTTTLPLDLRTDLLTHVVARRTDARRQLVRVLASGQPPAVRRAAYDALAHQPGGGDDTVETDRDFVADELACTHAIAIAHRSVQTSDPATAAALEDDFRQTRRALFGALALHHDPTRIRDIEILVESRRDDDRANALEALEVALAHPLARGVVRALECETIDDVASMAATRGVEGITLDVASLPDDRSLSPWTRRVAAARDASPPDPSSDPGALTMPALITTVMSLKSVDIFSTLPYDTIAELAALVSHRSYPAGATILEEGSVGDDLFALVAGAVHVTSTRGDDATIEGQTVFGELAVLDPGPRAATVRAVTDVDVLVLTRHTLLALSERQPAVMVSIAGVLAKRLRG